MSTATLGGRVVALSMSPANDLARLGYPPREFEQIAFELALRVVRAGGRVSHGGHLQEGSLLVETVDYLAATYRVEAGADKPLLHLLAQSELASTSFARLAGSLARLRAFAETIVPLAGGGSLGLSGRRSTDESGAAVDTVTVRRDGGPAETVRSQAELDALAGSLPAATVPGALRAMREAQVRLSAARIAIGGRRGDLGTANDAFSGAMPGIYEEALIAIDAGQPVLFLGAFGGAARDAAIDLGLLPEAERVPLRGAMQDGVAEARAQMQARRDLIPADRRAALAQFAARDDCEELARDAVAWIAAQGTAA